MLSAAKTAFNDIWTHAFRAVFWKVLGLTFLLLVLVWWGLQFALSTFLVLPFAWLETLVAILAGFGSVIALAFLIAPISSAVSGLFLDPAEGHQGGQNLSLFYSSTSSDMTPPSASSV